LPADPEVLRVADTGTAPLVTLLQKFDLQLVLGHDDDPIPGSFWGEPEAGIVKCDVHVRSDTPIHSVLHETSHLICASGDRRDALQTDAGSDDLEEAAVCYLQILLSDFLPGVGRERLMRDMDAWGYSFRLGSSFAWFSADAEDALAWLQCYDVVDKNGEPLWALRD
jgi:hypothetical protein